MGSIPNSKQTQKLACYLMSRSEVEVVLTAFTFDYEEVCQALVKAAARGVRVELYVDRNHTLTDATVMQPAQLSSLRKQGVVVYLTSSAQRGGIQHSKTILCDDTLLVGSTNWTNSSRSNHELSLAVSLSPEGKDETCVGS